MRRQDRHIVNGAVIFAGVTALADIFIQWLEHKERGMDFTWERVLISYLPHPFVNKYMEFMPYFFDDFKYLCMYQWQQRSK